MTRGPSPVEGTQSNPTAACRLKTWCQTCELEPATRSNGEGETCFKYRQRHGKPRPEKLIQLQIDRYHHNLTPWRPGRIMEG